MKILIGAAAIAVVLMTHSVVALETTVEFSSDDRLPAANATELK